MGTFGSFEISASGMDVERRRLEVSALNLANANTTRTADGSAFQRKILLARATPAPSVAGDFPAMSAARGPGQPEGPGDLGQMTFGPSSLSSLIGSRPWEQASAPAGGACAAALVDDPSPPRREYIPGHPDADAQGWVTFPNVEPVTEMVELMMATRAYEANAASFGAARDMAVRAIDMGR